MGQKLVAKFAFLPPQNAPPPDTENATFLRTKNGYQFPVLWFVSHSSVEEHSSDTNAELDYTESQDDFSNSNSDLDSALEEEIKEVNLHAAEQIKHEMTNRFTIIFSHGNAESITLIYYWAKKFTEKTKTNMLLYEYSGYPYAEGECSEENTYDCAEAAYDFLVEKKGILPQNIVFFGHSLGSGPTVQLAITKECAGVILMSPLLSCMRTISKMSPGFDIFCNIQKVDKIHVPTLILHGQSDMIVSYSHGKTLFETIKKEFQYKLILIEEAGHNDIESNFEKIFYSEINAFLKHLELFEQKKKKSKKIKLKKEKIKNNENLTQNQSENDGFNKRNENENEKEKEKEKEKKKHKQKKQKYSESNDYISSLSNSFSENDGNYLIEKNNKITIIKAQKTRTDDSDFIKENTVKMPNIDQLIEKRYPEMDHDIVSLKINQFLVRECDSVMKNYFFLLDEEKQTKK
ncbi:hypothetical protein M0811_03715 [Anaeramoeba ignava]|uniref:Serine aminopeptidase S33 domain-containing protein n=1 Tax=Anaeramoeba ignava TaxID=1746090 RepID=A0A9Q0RGM6_ANAIG|nr:hypothetical protein M0811_03715 [Anaeramoeba ignava]